VGKVALFVTKIKFIINFSSIFCLCRKIFVPLHAEMCKVSKERLILHLEKEENIQNNIPMKPKVLININEFGPLRNQVLEFAPFLLFTGHSGLGKSYANYLVYYLMRSLSSDAWYELVSKKLKKNKESRFQLTINEVFGYFNDHVQGFMRDFLGDPTLICDVVYRCETEEEEFSPVLLVELLKDEIEAHGEGDSVFHYVSAKVKVNEEEVRSSLIDEDPAMIENFVGFAINKYLQNVFFEQKFAKSVILPPARGALVGENYSMKDAVTSSCKMYDYFIRDYEEATRPYRFGRIKEPDTQFFTNRVKELLHGELISDKGIQYLVLSSDKRIPLTSAASSVKELSPFLFYLRNWSNFIFSFCIEEPEAHLHPSMQMDLADLIAACRNKGMMFQMTTHSDYFIMRINQLLRIGKLRRENPELYKQFQAQNKLNNRFYLNEEDIICYYFQEDQGVRVTKLPIENGILPMRTFYKAMNDIDEFDRKLDDEFEELL
jgi:hypothetical protein